jgi:hypothetical protein
MDWRIHPGLNYGYGIHALRSSGLHRVIRNYSGIDSIGHIIFNTK